MFYGVGTICKDSWFNTFTDLWANLFASLIVLLGIEWIVRQSRLERIEPSKRYIKGRIAQILLELMRYSKPPSDWKARLESGSEWSDFYAKLLGVRRKALGELKSILDIPEYLLDDKLRNDVSLMLRILNVFSYEYIEGRHIRRARELWSAAGLSATVISQSIEIIKRNGLLANLETIFTFRKGEAPKVEAFKTVRQVEHSYSIYEKQLEETIKFRDECERILSRKK